MKDRTHFFMILQLLTGLLFFNLDGLACSCSPTRPTVAEEFDSSEHVVITRLSSVEKVPDEDRGYDRRDIREVKMIVDKVYKGNLKVGQVLTFGQGDGVSCIMSYSEKEIGELFIFYLGKPSVENPTDDGTNVEPIYYVSFCGRSKRLDRAADDLAYLDKLDKVRGKTRLSGTLETWYRDPPGFDGVRINLLGKGKTYRAKTDKLGFYEIYDLPPGKYFVEIEIPFGWKIDEHSPSLSDPLSSTFYDSRKRLSIYIEQKKHVVLDLRFNYDTAIIGRLLSPSGKPMKGVCITAVSSESALGDYRGAYACTNEKGDFLIKEMEPGSYILVANDDAKMSERQPFGLVFFPGVESRELAGVVSVELGRYATGLVFQIAQTIDLFEIKGTLLFSDGRPVAEETVKFVPVDDKRFDEVSVDSDKQGRFSFRIPKGAAGKIFGNMFAYTGENPKCPQLEALIKATGSKGKTFLTNEIEIDGATPLDSLELKLPFPFCEKAK